jgi:hypothetical protein
MAAPQVIVRYSSIQEAFQQNPDRVTSAVHDGANQVAGGDSVEKAGLVAAWNGAMSALAQEDSKAAVMSTPRDALASRIQSQIASAGADAGKVQTLHPAATVHTEAGDFESPEAVEVKFSDDDFIGWIGMSWKLIFKPEKASWIDPPRTPEVLQDDAKIAVFGDWGTGLYGATTIAQSISKMERCDVVLHLGDTYYSGTNDEVYKRLVTDWPKRIQNTVNRSLNGNHEMYSGGQGYFNALKAFFNQSASCFAMQNSNWLLVGLDTAYEDGDLSEMQIDWLKFIVASAGSRKLILFSHHQPFSQLDTQGPNLQHKLHDLLSTQRIHAWFWGHEHRLVVYDPHRTWGFKGRCVGHGGYPAFRDDLPGIGGNLYQWIGLTEQSFAPAAKMLDGPNFWVTADPMHYSPHGYAVLEFDGPSCRETYRTADGIALGGAELL